MNLVNSLINQAFRTFRLRVIPDTLFFLINKRYTFLQIEYDHRSIIYMNLK